MFLLPLAALFDFLVVGLLPTDHVLLQFLKPVTTWSRQLTAVTAVL